MKISIVIPVRNEAAYLPRCLAAIKRQSQSVAEVIVVDNASTDDSVAIAKRAGATVITGQFAGQAETRGRGFDVVKTELIGRIDADTVLAADWAAKVIANFQDYPNLAAVTGPAVAYDFWRPVSALAARWYLRSTQKLFGHVVLWGANMALTKQMWLKVRGQVCLDDTLVHEDQDLAAVIAKAGGTMRIDWNLKVAVSARRFKSLTSTIEYFRRRYSTLRHHSIKRAWYRI
ncbi:glycosyltransferase family 2 protein [Candidatus Microgenomates bacterium]|nr:glycosyltransferase family 2 protein [Candidatus Microgenomates bacterium]